MVSTTAIAPFERCPLSTIASSVSSGTTTSRDARGRYPLYGSTGRIGSTNRNEFTGPSILVARVGANAGSVYAVNGSYGVTDNTLVVRLKQGHSVAFVTELLKHAELNRMVYGSGQPLVTGTMVKQLDIPAVPQPEQQRIAVALDDANAHIDALERLAAKKVAIKQGMMQELLTGRTRLPGFGEPWLNTTWGELTERCSSGATPPRSQSTFWGGSIPWVTSTELKYGTITKVPQSVTRAGFAAANLTLWPAGTFLMAITGLEAAGTRGSCGVLGIPAASNQSCMAIVPNNRLTSGYLYHYYVLRGDDLALRYCQGTKQQSYTAGIVRTLPIYLPTDIEEQKAIAQVLTDADSELDLLRRRLGKARSTKVGMMQQLVTGHTRLLTVEGAL